ncbi:MAG TPA: DinB family protein [Vicinamibacterales bacterium]|nr:DinB family protein [Vicinamibacterales bacterium]
MKYEFLIDSYETERIKVLSVWCEFRDEDLPVRPKSDDLRGRSVHEHMVHQCISEDAWFRTMLDIDVAAAPLPALERRLEFMKRYAEDSANRLARLRATDDSWWEAQTTFFDVRRSKAWVMTRRLTHTSHHRGQQMAMLRMLGRELHSNYGPTADTGGLMKDHAPTIYAYASVDALLREEDRGGAKSPLPGAAGKIVTERPQIQPHLQRSDRQAP